MVTLPAAVLRRYRRFSLYNSPYSAHDRGCAIDLYPETDEALSPVAGEVVDAKSVRAPPKPYATERDHLVLVDVDAEASGLTVGSDADDGESGLVARILHVNPRVTPGDRVGVGDPLGTMVRSGFFGQWVDNHVHLGFRDGGRNVYRASGSLPVDVDVAVEPLPWDGTGTVVDVGETYVVLDSPTHPEPGAYFAGVAAERRETPPESLGPPERSKTANGRSEAARRDAERPDGGPASDTEGTSSGGERSDRPNDVADGDFALDGGLAHYAGGGVFPEATGPVFLLGAAVGVADGRDVTWGTFDVMANGERVTGVSLFAAQDAEFGAKLVAFDHDFVVGDRIAVSLRPNDDPVRLGRASVRTVRRP